MSMHTVIAWCCLGLALICTIIIAIDEIRHLQKMGIMRLVWPITALYFSVFALLSYFHARIWMTKVAMAAMGKGEQRKKDEQSCFDPTTTQTPISDSHGGAGCTLRDITSVFSIWASI